MAVNRDQAIKELLEGLNIISPGNPDIPKYEAMLKKMSLAQITKFMEDLRDDKANLSLTIPNFSKVFHHSIEHAVEAGDKLGVKLFQRVWEGDRDGVPAYLSPVPRLVGYVPVRLASQRLSKKMSIPTSQRHINSLTGQATGNSKGAAISAPELRVCASMGLNNTMVELMKYRGGDLRGAAALTASLVKTGQASVRALSYFASGVESTATLKSYLTACHLKNNL